MRRYSMLRHNRSLWALANFSKTTSDGCARCLYQREFFWLDLEETTLTKEEILHKELSLLWCMFQTIETLLNLSQLHALTSHKRSKHEIQQGHCYLYTTYENTQDYVTRWVYAKQF